MTDILFRILEISIQASVLTLAVLVLRFLFKKAPKSWRCALWGLVALRLLLPYSLQSPMSLQPDTAPMRDNMEYIFSAVEEAIPDTSNGEGEFTTQAFPALPQTEQQTKSAPSFFAKIELPRFLIFAWLSGIALLFLYAGIGYLLLRRKTAAALRLKDNVFLIDEIPSPFLLGVLCPRIYLPDALPEEQREHVIAHEQAHIRRGDHILKPLAFLIVSVYWFNPVLWLGYILFNRDLELACDERVIRDYDPARRAAYAETLLLCGQAKRSAALSPLAFGEVGVKTRVKQALSYKNPALWIMITAAAAAVVAAVCLLTVPKTGEPIGVELLAENENGELSYYKVLSDGTLRQKPDAPGGGYGGLSAEADCFGSHEENGKTRVEVLKTELCHPDGAPAPVTEEREAVFYAVAAASKHEIRKMEIFEMPVSDGRTFVAVEYKTYAGSSSEVFRYDPAEKSLEELCVAENLRVMNVYATAPATKTPSDPAPYAVGVEIIAMDADGIRTFDVLSDGTAAEIPSGVWGAYGGIYAEADCFSARTENGKKTIAVIKKALLDTARQEVPITDEYSAIFDAAAENAADEIVLMQIFETATEEHSIFVALEYPGSETDVFRFDPANKTLVRLCRMEGPRVRDVYIKPIDKTLDLAVHDAILEDQADKGWQGECGTEGHILLGTKETKTETVVYVLHSYASFGFVNDCFAEVGGHSMPLAIHLRQTEDGYSLLRIDTPKDGGDYAASVRRLFPKEYRDRIFSNSEADAESLWRQCVSQAEAYLQIIDRSAQVKRDVEYVWLDDLIDSDIVNNAIRVNPELTGYPLWIGTREQIENGVRYVYAATQAESETKNILFYKTAYGSPNDIVESFLVNAETGEIIERNSAFVF